VSAKSIVFHLLVSDDAIPSRELEAALTNDGCSVERIDARGLTPIEEYVVVASVAASSFFHIINTLRRMFRRGLLIDARSGECLVKADPALPRGMVIVRGEDGSLQIRDGEPFPSTALDLVAKSARRSG
jgi:hypothetical protein